MRLIRTRLGESTLGILLVSMNFMDCNTSSNQIDVLDLSYVPPLTSHHTMHKRRSNNPALIPSLSQKYRHRNTTNKCQAITQSYMRASRPDRSVRCDKVNTVISDVLAYLLVRLSCGGIV
ncbi:hypothetical protein E2P81_ATG01778 [Venturia nashicola]|uniref:Uncharacterized protein n=1 Tax=Venturia nashicola TaxID=86259 RepID=A0A4Z1PJZ1_9PEZI|nr:hypothetical protein E6O75_ATG01826 [Venturia nashicola]TLD35475.1 hypothetical protein E2P81_ATG01778 [Venturia nashicola]